MRVGGEKLAQLAGAVEELAVLLEQLGDGRRAATLRTDAATLRTKSGRSVDVDRMQRILGGMASLASRAPLSRAERLRQRLCQALE